VNSVYPLLVAACVDKQVEETATKSEPGETGLAMDTTVEEAYPAPGPSPVRRPPCANAMDAHTLKLCGASANDFLGSALDEVVGSDGTASLLVGSIGAAAVYSVGGLAPGSHHIDTNALSAELHPAPFDSGFGNALDAKRIGDDAYVAIGSPNTWWIYDADGRAYLYGLDDFGQPDAEPLAAVSGGSQMLLGTAVAVLSGTGADPGMVIGREPDYGGAGLFPTAYVFWDMPGPYDDITSADLTLTSDGWYTRLGEHVMAADLDGDGVDEALFSAEGASDWSRNGGVVVADAGLSGTVPWTDLEGAWSGGFDPSTNSFGVADLTGDGMPEIIEIWASEDSEYACRIGVMPAPVSQSVFSADALGGIYLSGVSSCHHAIAVADFASASDVTLVAGSGNDVLVYHGSISGWVSDSELTRIRSEEEDDYLGRHELAISDVDGDSVREVIASANRAGDTDAGAVYVLWDL
jgi:hypothetical protein